MSGGAPVAGARVRIKGRKGSVVRFLIISIAYTLPWIIMLSQLAYYSKIYGPQVLLQLNIAYYLPSIPVLLLIGHVEKLLDAEFGHTASMAIRLLSGLAACAAIAAYYPFMPPHLKYLLGLVVVLGAVSSVAFSTSYQLVAWFRSADTIALGIGCVASGPLALVIQVALQIGTTPKHWQWIALFEAAAGFVVLGLLAALSLLWQYWGIISGTVQYSEDMRQPLLSTEAQAQEDHVDEEAGAQALMLSRVLTLQDPFQGFPFTTTPGMVMPHFRTLRRAASDDISDRRRHARSGQAAAVAQAGAAGLQPPSALHGHSAAAMAAAAVVAASSSNRTLQHSRTCVLARPSAPLHSSTDSLFDGGLGGALPPSSGASAAAAAGFEKGGSSIVTVAPEAAAAAAMQQYSGLPMVPPPSSSISAPGGASCTYPGGPAPASAAWFLDIEQQVAGSSSGGAASREQWLLGAVAGSIASSSPRSSRPASPSPAMQVPGAALGNPAAVAVGSFVGELSDFAGWAQQHDQPAIHHQQIMGVVGGSAPSMPLAATLLEDDDSHRAAARLQGSPSPTATAGNEYFNAASAAGADISNVLPARQRPELQEQQQRQQAHPPPQPPVLQQQHQQQQQRAKPPQLPSPQTQQQHQQVVAVKRGHRRTGSAASASAASQVSVAAADSVAGSDVASTRDLGKEEPESLATVFAEVIQGTWMVVLAALISSTLLNCIFPFFTYVASSGLLGEFLPQVLFYTRMLSDIVGRMLPRKKALAITAPAALLALSGALALCGTAFFVYLQVPPHMQHDTYVLVLVLVLWLGGGYINTMSYILAPSLVAPRVCTKASAVMALTYQVAHILGLVIAIGLALVLYGDISGSL